MLAALPNLGDNGANPEMTLPLEAARFEALKKLAGERFGEITPAEEEVLRLSASAEDIDTPESEDRPEVRAAFLRWLATDKDVAAHIDPLGLRVENATITLALDLNFSKVPFPLRFERCTFQGGLCLGSAVLPALSLRNCKAEHGITADNLRVQSSLFLRKLEAKGELRFPGAQIGGDLDCAGATLTAEGNALSADRASIAGNVFLKEKFSCSGEIRLLGAQIGGDLDCSGAALTAEGDALSADGANITRDVFLREKFSCSGAIRFLGAQIGGNLDCSSAGLTAKGDALSADGANVAGSVFFREKLSCSGEIRLLGARIGGNLECTGATLTAKGVALSADKADITGSVFLGGGFSCSGTMRFPQSQIGGDLECSGAKIRALMCENMRLEGDLIWTGIRDPKSSFLNLCGASVKTLRDDTASRPARGNLVVNGLEYRDLAHHEPSTETHHRKNLLAPQRPLDAGERIQWLLLQDGPAQEDPQPWAQLRQLFESKGDKRGAKEVEFAFRRRMAESKPWFFRWYEKGRLLIGSLALNLFFDLEDNLVRILIPILILFAAGYAVFLPAWRMGVFVPTQSDANAAFVRGQPLPRGYPVFSPSIYALETILPVIKLGQVDYWAPDAHYKQVYWYCSYPIVAGTRYALTILGWILGLILVTAITGRLR